MLEQQELSDVDSPSSPHSRECEAAYAQRKLKDRISHISMKGLPDLDPATDFKYICR